MQNGGIPTQRPPFRRQGSSVAGGHPMIVALAPQRVDYSVTKGGARTWAVLLVFMFLCSSLYTVFSAKEVAELGVDFDGDGDVDLDNDVDDDADEVATQQKHALKDTTPTHDERSGHERRKEVPVPVDDIKTADDDDAYVETTLEEKLFAGLRAKMQKIQNYVKTRSNSHYEDDDSEEILVPQKRERRKQRKALKAAAVEEKEPEVKPTSPPPPPSKPVKEKKTRKEKKPIVIEDNDDDDDDEDDDEPKSKSSKKKVQRLKYNPRTRREELVAVEEDGDDEDSDDDDDKKNDDEGDDDESDNEGEKEDDDDEKDKEDDKEKEDEEATSESEPEPEPEEEENRKSRRDDDDDDEEENQISKFKRSRGIIEEPRAPKLKTAHITDEAPKRECKRKNCPTDFGIEPRKSLLKNKPTLTGSKRYQYYVEEDNDSDDDEDDDDDDDDTVDDDNDDDDEEEEYAELVAVKKYRTMGREEYRRHAITNRDDHRHRDVLDRADHLVEKHNYAEALSLFEKVLKMYPESPRAHFGRGRAFDIRGELNAEDDDIDEALEEYEKVLENEDTPDALFEQAASRVVERSRFLGNMHRSLNAQRALIDRFPDEPKYQTDFGLTFLMMKRHDDARKVFKNILDSDPNNAIALAYYGYILKVADDDIDGGVQMMRKGLQKGSNEIIDPKFYYHLGDGLMQLGRMAEAYKVYEQGAELGLFLSAHQRSMYNVEGLTGRPWWTLEQTTYTKHLKTVERQWVAIRAEALNAIEEHADEFELENKDITVDGDWRALWLLKNEEWDEEHCEFMPQTCAILQKFRESSNASRSAMKISVLSSGTRVLPHCGATNAKLQAHLGLVVPSEARIRVASDRRGWRTGRFIVFDDSFEHELSFEGASSSAFRLVLVVDLWHPEVDVHHRPDLFDED